MSVCRFIDAGKASRPASPMCRAPGAARPGYYARGGRGPSTRDLEDGRLTGRARSTHGGSRGTYGSPRVHAELRCEGVRVGRERGAGTPPAPDLVGRDWDRRRPDALWLADITFVPTREGWPYLASILDAHSRRVVGWSMAGHTGAELVIGALSMAVARRGPRPPGSVHHPGRGSRYTSPEFGRALKEASIPPSTGGVGSPHDNAMAESSVATLKTGLLDRRPRPTREAARGAIFEYLERFHNPRRRRSALGYASPIEDERSMMTEATAA